MDALEKEPLLINSHKNQDKKIFFEYKLLLNISRTNFYLKSVAVSPRGVNFKRIFQILVKVYLSQIDSISKSTWSKVLNVLIKGN